MFYKKKTTTKRSNTILQVCVNKLISLFKCFCLNSLLTVFVLKKFNMNVHMYLIKYLFTMCISVPYGQPPPYSQVATNPSASAPPPYTPVSKIQSSVFSFSKTS